MNRAGISRIAFAVTLTLGLPALASAQLAPNATTARAMKLERFVAPEFPPFLRQAGILQGTVVVAIGHDIRGKVNDTLVLESSDPRFTAATLDAIREWRFEAKPASTPMLATTVPVVRFLFTTGSVSMVSLTASGRTGTRQSVRAETPIELPNFSHLDETPRALSSPAPEFPPALRSRNAQGTVVVKYFVDPEGRVRLPTVITATEPEFATSALAAISQWRFDPPRIDGKPVIALERHSFQFAGATTDPTAPSN